jgi:hypothetical protein
MHFEMFVELDNSAFDNAADLPRILRQSADKLAADWTLRKGFEWKLYDKNGNTVGIARIVKPTIRGG